MEWRKSASCSTNSCMEVADLDDGGHAVRDGKLGDDSPVLVFDPVAWAAFMNAVKVDAI